MRTAPPDIPRCWPATCLPVAAKGGETLAEVGVAESNATPAAYRCGWFDSSLELQHGLKVRECSLTEATLPLNWWLLWQSQPLSLPVTACED